MKKTLMEKMIERDNEPKSEIFITIPGMTEHEKEKAILEHRINELENKFNYALVIINQKLVDIENINNL